MGKWKNLPLLGARRLREAGGPDVLEGDLPDSSPSPSPTLLPAVWSQPVGLKWQEKCTPPSKLLHICAQTKAAINPGLCVSVWVLNSTWLCASARGDWRGFMDNKRSLPRGLVGGSLAQRPQCIHSEPAEGSWEPSFSQN